MDYLIHFRARRLRCVAVAMFGVILGFDAALAWADDVSTGAVYSLTNGAQGNELVVYQRDRQGGLTLAGMVPTGGLGTGAGLGSQAQLRSGRKGGHSMPSMPAATAFPSSGSATTVPG